VDDELAGELRALLAAKGYEGDLRESLENWAGTENYELRVDGIEHVDPVVLAELRRSE
jgi:hypothetical protein